MTETSAIIDVLDHLQFQRALGNLAAVYSPRFRQRPEVAYARRSRSSPA
jgi:hypothetical protein